MTPIITVAYLSVLACALFVLIRWPRLRLQGDVLVGEQALRLVLGGGAAG